ATGYLESHRPRLHRPALASAVQSRRLTRLVGGVMLRSARACSQLSADRRSLPVAFGVRIKACLVRPPFHQEQSVWILGVLENVELLAAWLFPHVSLKG